MSDLREDLEEMLRQWGFAHVTPNDEATLRAAESDVRAVLRRHGSEV